MKNDSIFMFDDRMWVAMHILSHLAAKKEHMFLEIIFCSSLSGFPLSNAMTVCLYIVFLPIYSSLL